MGECKFEINITPKEAYDILTSRLEYELIYDEKHCLDGDKQIYIMIFEKYFFRTSNRGTLTITLNNFSEETQVNCLAAGTSQGMIFNFDWGARESFVNKAINILEPYIKK